MLVSLPIVALSALSAVSARAPTSETHAIHERSTELSEEWTKLEWADKTEHLPVRIGLTQSNIDHAEEVLMEISDPTSSRYGQHLTSEQVADLFAPQDESVAAVQNWLQSEGIDKDRISQSQNRQWIQFDASVSEVESLLHTKYHVYINNRSGARQVGTDHYSLPHELLDHIDVIKPAVVKKHLREHTKVPRPEWSSRRMGNRAVERYKWTKNCSHTASPHCIFKQYDIPRNDADVPGNDIGIFALAPMNQADLDAWYYAVAPYISNGTGPTIDNIDGAYAVAPPHGLDEFEPILDLDVTYPIVYPQGVVLYSVDDYYYDYKTYRKGMFNTFLDALDGSYCNFSAFGETGDNPKYDPVYPDPHPRGWKYPTQCGTYNATNVISLSYGAAEFQASLNYDRRQCLEWMKLTLQGVTIVSASGDSGVDGGSCPKKHGHRIFNPYIQASCPYIVSVGSTILPAVPKQGDEVATDLFGSGGGFSNIFPTPEWQQAHVDGYFEANPSPYKFYRTKYGKNLGANGGLFNRAGRGIPDVAAVGQNVAVVYREKHTAEEGTSASAPLFASLISRINGERLRAGKSSVGFIHPTLYKNPHVFTDVTSGNNPGCGTDGFNASAGWDPVTGLGTPNYPKLLDLFMSFP